MTAHPINTEALREWIESQRHHEGVTLHVSIESAGALLDALAAAEHRATRAEAERDWNIRSSRNAKRGRIRANARADQAEARIDAATTVLDEDTRWQNDEHLLARVREALDGDA